MEYLLILLAALFFSTQFIFFKLYQKYSDSSINAVNWHLLMSAFFTSILTFTINKFSLDFSFTAMLYIMIYVICTIVTGLASIFALKFGSVAIMIVFSQIGGMALPFLYGIFVLGEEINFYKILGIIILILALFPNFIAKRKNTNTGNNKNIIYILICIVIFLCTGFVSIVSKAHQISNAAIGTNDFIIWASLVRVMFLIPIILVYSLIQKKRYASQTYIRLMLKGVGRELNNKWLLTMFAFSLGYAVCNSLGNIFSLNAAKTMDSSIQFPILSAWIIVFTVITTAISFKEKPKKFDILTIGLSLIGILIYILA